MELLYEKLPVWVYPYPFAKQINPFLYSFISSLNVESNSYKRNKSQNLIRHIKNKNFHIKNKNVEVLVEWITNIINRDGERLAFANGTKIPLECTELWSVLYNTNDEVTPHSHMGYRYTFSYYVKSHEKSSPLVFTTSGYEIYPEEGDLIIFDAAFSHHVPPNQCDNRCVLVGNYI